MAFMLERDNTVDNNTYNKEVQAKYKAKCMQIAIRYGVNGEDKRISEAIESYCDENNCSRGNLARVAIAEKLKREGFLD